MSCNTCKHLCRWSQPGRAVHKFEGLFCMALDEYLDSVDAFLCEGVEYEED